ncbi:MAG: TIGR03905 family TSCPD domain-containing protein [Clostridia bacterium]|nr:TIGR03905 family TSCPD domain-containing protein [Clostridia bacterium]
MRYSFRTSGTCSQKIEFDISGGKVTNVVFTGGCNGNLKAISKLVNGMDADKINSILRGNTCGFRPTSCADQLAIAVMEAKAKEESMQTV